MFRTTLKDIFARKLRIVTTTLAVMLGVAFMSGTLTLTNTIQRTFDELFADAYENVDARVRSDRVVEGAMGGELRPRISEAVFADVESVEGVAVAESVTEGYAQIVDADGEPIGNPGQGAPTFGTAWPAADELNPFTLVDGRGVESDGEVVIDNGSAKKGKLDVGDEITVLTQAGPIQAHLVGIVKFGTADSPGGASFAMFTPAETQRLVGEPGKVDAIDIVAADGVSQDEIRDRLDAALPAGFEAITGADLTEETQSTMRQGLSFFAQFMVSFALIALFVGSFIIYNTFSIIVAQRSRELALLRAIGASRRQVTMSVLLEAVVVGLLAGVLGVAAGLGVAALLKQLLGVVGFDIPAGGLAVKANAVVLPILVGLLITVVSAVMPARRAAKVAPVAAMRDVQPDAPHASTVRLVIGLLIAGAGTAAVFAGLFGDAGDPITLVGPGAAAMFIGIAVLGPVIAKPVTRLLGAPLPAAVGMTGTLATANAVRNPKRTSATAAALMIGVALVGFITIFASSAKASIDAIIADAFKGDFVVNSPSFGTGGLTPDVAERLRELPEVDAASGVRVTSVEIEGSPLLMSAVDAVEMDRIVDIGVSDGDLAKLDADGLAVHNELAERKGWKVGDTVDVTFVKTGKKTLTIEALYTERDLAGDYVVGLKAFQENVAEQFDMQVFVKKTADVDVAEARTAIEAVVADYPQAELQNQSEYVAEQSAGINQMLTLIYALLLLAVVIALMGIANTLALSVFERTRELGLLRAVGMFRGQVRGMVMLESVLIALLGAFLGLVIGTFFGWAMVRALESEGFSQFQVPVPQIAFMVTLAAVAGVLAAVLPARRAARLDVLGAIATA